MRVPGGHLLLGMHETLDEAKAYKYDDGSEHVWTANDRGEFSCETHKLDMLIPRYHRDDSEMAELLRIGFNRKRAEASGI